MLLLRFNSKIMHRITFATKKEIVIALKEKSEHENKSRSQIINEILQDYFEKKGVFNCNA